MSHHVAMEQDSTAVKVKEDQGHTGTYGGEDFYDSYHVFTAFDSDLKLSGSGSQRAPLVEKNIHAGSIALSELDISLPSTDLDSLETRIFGKQRSGHQHSGLVRHHLEKTHKTIKESTQRKNEIESKRYVHTGDSDPEDHVFHPEIVPFEPAKQATKLTSADPRQLLDSKGKSISIKVDPSTARYLKILVPQRDARKPGERSLSETLVTSPNLFESLSTSAAERLLLESPTQSPSHFQQAQLCLNTADSEAETSISAQDVDPFVLYSTPKQRNFSQHSGLPSLGRSSHEIEAEIFDFEDDFKRAVADTYLESEPGIAPLSESSCSMETLHADENMSQARSELEKAFGGGEEFITSAHNPHHPPAKMSAETFHSLVNTSDALALQKSVVSDSSVKPASMDEIAALLESVQKGDYQKNQSLNSLNSTLQSTDNHSVNDSTHEKQYNSMSSLDETPSRIPADYVEPEATPAAMNGIEPLEVNPNDFKEEEMPSKTGSNTAEPSEEQHSEKQGKKAKTVQKRPSSLLAQNTTLAISSAVVHKYKVSPQDEVLSPTGLAPPAEPKLYRSPVQAVTTTRGGKIASAEGLEKPKPKKKKGKKGGKRSAVSNRLVSDTDTEPPSDTEFLPGRPITALPDANNTGHQEPAEGESMHHVDIEEPIISETIHNTLAPKEDSEPPHQHEEEEIDGPQIDQQHLATSPPEATSASMPTVPEKMPTSAPEKPSTQPAPAVAPEAEASSSSGSGSFLGSLFPWGRRAEKPVAPSNSPSTSQAEASKEEIAGGSPKTNSQDHDLHSDSVDSGVDVIPSVNGDVAAGNDVVPRPEPISSSTPHVARSTGRVDEIVPHQASQQHSYPAPARATAPSSVQHVPPSAPGTHTAPAPHVSRAMTHVQERTRSNPYSRASGYQSSRYMPPVAGQQGDGEELQDVLREKAKLEGQLEMLMSESESALQARTQLQSQVAILQAKLKAQGSGGDGSSYNRSALENEISSLKENKGLLEQTINKLQVEIDSKEADLEGLRRELQVSETNNGRIQAKLAEVKKEIGAREITISQLKDKMAAMQGQVDQSRQEQSIGSAKLSSLETDVESLTKARDWFQEQLGFAQDIRSQLQAELSSHQTKVASQASMIETLKTENTKVKHDLSDARQRMLHEKEQIAKHLETIEADIMTREATFSAMQREKTAVQQAVFTQMDQMEEEKYRLAGLVASASELERQLDVARQELEAKHTALVGLEAEKRELVKGLALAEEALAARETEMQALQVKCNNLEKKLREEQGKSMGQDNEVRQLRADKASLEAALATANQEKETFDESLQKLRGDLSRVETGFKQMRQELGAKTSQLESAEMEGQQVKEQLKDQEKQLDAQQANLEASIAAIGNKDAIIDDLIGIRGKLEQEIDALKREMTNARSSYEGFMQANTGLQGDLSKAREGFQMLEHQLQETLAENANLQGRLESLSEDHKQFSELMDENAALRQRVADTQSTMHREMAEQKASALRLGADLSNVQKELREKEHVYEATIGALTRQLEDASVERDEVERELCEKTAAVAQMSKEEQERMLEELQGIKEDADVLRGERNRLNAEVQRLRLNLQDETEAYKKRVDDLEAELEELREALDYQRRNELENRSLALDLERERGRLAGVHQSHSALKQHTGMLESALAQRETAMVELTEELNSSSQDKTSENMRLHKHLREIGAALEREKELSQEIRKQLAGEKGDNSRLRQDLQTQSLDTQEVKGQMQQKDEQIAALGAELAKLKQNEERERKEREAARRELEKSKGQMERLKRQLQDRDAQGPVVQDQMKTLAWKSEQKAREAAAIKEQLELAEKRQEIELDGVKSNLQMTNQELDGVKRELATTRKEKFAFQAKLSQLKSALQATVQQNKLLKAKLKSKSRVAATIGKTDGAGEGKGLAEEIVVPEIAYDVESLLNSDVVEGVSASQSRPLHAIQSCLQSIKDQMGALEDQMKEHTAAVNDTSEAWKEVSNKVHDLRRASVDPVTPSPSLQFTHSKSNGAEPLPSNNPPRTRGVPEKTASASKPSLKQPMIYDI